MTRAKYVKDIEFYKGVTIVRLKGDITALTVDGVQAEFAGKTKGKYVKNVLFDLTEVIDSDTAGVAALVDLLRYMKNSNTGGKIALINVPLKVQGLMQISKTQPLFMMFQLEEDAINSLI